MNLYNKDAEYAVIACMVLDKECAERAMELKEEDFYTEESKRFLRAIKKLQAEKKPVDLTTISNYIAPDDSFIIKEIVNNQPTTANFNHYFDLILQYSKRRNLIKAANQIIKDTKDTEKNINEIVEKAEKEVLQVNERSLQEYTPITEIFINNINEIERRYKNPGFHGVITGFTDLDITLGGLQKGNVIFLAARPAMGKTALAVNIAMNTAKFGHTTAIFSLEMSKEELVNRILSFETRIDSTDLAEGRLNDNDFAKIAQATAKYVPNKEEKDRLVIDDTPNLDTLDILARCRRIKKRLGKLDLVVIDYLQLMKLNTRWQKREGVEENSRNLKTAAKELGCPIICLSQLSRAPEGRQNKRPILSDLRETGQIEQDADVVMFLYRDDYYNADTDEAGIAECIIAKHRNGPTGTIKLKWTGECTRFDNLEQYREEG